MSAELQTQVKAAPKPSFTPASSGLLQRECACGGSPGITGECEECQKKRLTLQRYPANRAEPSKLLHFSHFDSQTTLKSGFRHNFSRVQVHNRVPETIQTKFNVNEPRDQYEQEADSVAEQVVMSVPPSGDPTVVSQLSSSPSMIQRSPAGESVETLGTAPTEATPETETAAETPSSGLIVEDDAEDVGPGQMRKSEFLDELQSTVCAAADAELAAVGQSTEGCPYIEKWIGYYRTRDSQHVERALRRYAPETSGVTSARDYIPLVSERVRRGVARWATTGEITGVPEELISQVFGGGLLGAVGSLISGVASAVSGFVGGIGRALGGIFTKAREGGAKEADPQAIQSQLGSGSSIDSSVKSRMESAFGYDFSRVRVHTDAEASELSTGLNARAFTVGSDIAFGAGEYKPGTLIGDALLAHELAHVVQQGGAVSSDAPLKQGGTEYNALEEDADESAVGAVVSMWSGAKRALANLAQNTKTSLRSGLRLQRCARAPKFSTASCTNPVKTLTVDLISLRGSSRNSTNDLDFANKVFKASCVQFSTGKRETASKADSDSWLGGDTTLGASPNCGSVHAEEVAMRNGAMVNWNLSSRLRVFYVEKMTIPDRAVSVPPFCATGTAAPFINHAYVTNRAENRSLAHEFGHILLNSASHTGIDNPADTDNLMVPTNTATGEVLDATQISTIYSNA